jgi:hypothetical protein
LFLQLRDCAACVPRHGLAGSRVRPHCPSLAMYTQQRWEVEPVLDTTCLPRMAGCAAVGGSSEEVEEKGPCVVQDHCRCVLLPPWRLQLTQGVSDMGERCDWGAADHGMGRMCTVA